MITQTRGKADQLRILNAKLNNPYQEGFKAGVGGFSRQSNPYGKHQPNDRTFWENGWYQGSFQIAKIGR
jgi:ribosome modulation factor